MDKQVLELSLHYVTFIIIQKENFSKFHHIFESQLVIHSISIMKK